MGCPLHVRFFIFLFVHFVYCLRVWLFWLFACVGASLNGQRVTENSEIRVHRHREREGSLPLNRPKGNVKSKKKTKVRWLYGCEGARGFNKSLRRTNPWYTHTAVVPPPGTTSFPASPFSSRSWVFSSGYHFLPPYTLRQHAARFPSTLHVPVRARQLSLPPHLWYVCVWAPDCSCVLCHFES